MTTLTLEKAFEACQANKSAWLQRREELTQAEQAYREQLAGSGHSGRSLQTLSEIIDVKKWEINQAAGRYIRSHEEVQRISIRNRLNDFMQAHGAPAVMYLFLRDFVYRSTAPFRTSISNCAVMFDGVKSP